MSLLRSRILSTLGLGFGLGFGLLAGACFSPYEVSDCEPGLEGCECFGNQTCNAGLECIGGFCVNPDATETIGDGDPGDGDPGDGDPGDGDPGDGDPGDGDGDPGDGSCDIWAQDCADGEKCMAYATDGTTYDDYKCVAIMGDATASDPCIYDGPAEASDTCGPGLQCWTPVTGDDVCFDLCSGSADDPVCPASTRCVIEQDFVPVCFPVCHALLQDCGIGEACWWLPDKEIFSCVFTTQDIPLGEPCGFVNDCAGGLTCTDAMLMPNCNGSACCAAFCDLSFPACPQMGTECTSFFEEGMAPAGWEDVGYCILPGA